MCDTLKEELVSAVDRKDDKQVIELLKAGVEVNFVSKSGHTVLGHAVQTNDLRVTKTILHCEVYYEQAIEEHSASAHTPDDGRSPLEESFSYLWGPLGPFKSRRLCDVNMKDVHERTALHYAAEQGNVDLLKQLLRAGCLVDVTDRTRFAPVHLALRNRHFWCVKSLLENTCSVNLPAPYAGTNKLSCLHMAAMRGLYDFTELLLSHKAEINCRDVYNQTPLHFAVTNCKFDIVEILLKHGAKVNARDVNGRGPLCEAIFQQSAKMVKMLIVGGAHVLNSNCEFLMQESVVRGDVTITKFLIDAGGQVSGLDRKGSTPLHLACFYGSTSMVELLTDYGATVSTKNMVSGNTALHDAVVGISESKSSVFEDIFKILLKHNANLDCETFIKGETPLYTALANRKFQFTRMLISNGSNPNFGKVHLFNIDNLYLAVTANDFDLVKIMVYAGFDMQKVNWIDDVYHPAQASNDVEKIKCWLKYQKTNPLSLGNLCRLSIRKVLKTNIRSKLNEMPLPSRVFNFLSFDAIESCFS